MIRRALILLLLSVPAMPAMAAIETTTITGTVYTPDGSVATGGRITCSLTPTPGRASDGSNLQVVASRYVATISGSGTVSFTLVPNDVISPAGTVYSCTYAITGPVSATFSESWSVTTAPDPVSIGAIARVGGPTLTLPTAPGVSGTTVVSNGSGGLTAITRKKIYCGHGDLDSDGDTYPDDRTMWDYDCDGTPETSDINTAGDFLCAPADGQTQLASRLADLDGDDTVDDKVCGTLRLSAGTFTTGATFEAGDLVTFSWSGLQVIGAGRASTILSIDFPRGTSTNPNQAGTLCGETIASGGAALYNLGGSYSSLSDVSIQGNTISPRVKLFGTNGDCDGDGTNNESSTDLASLRGLDMSGTTQANSIFRSRVSRVTLLRQDVSCMYAQFCVGCVIEDSEAGFCGEHAFAVTSTDLNVNRIYGHDVGNPTNGGYGIEVFFGGAYGNDQSNVTITNSLFERVRRGIWAYEPTAATLSNLTVANNTVRNTLWAGAAGTPYSFCLGVGGGGGSSGNIKNVKFLNNTLTECGEAGIFLGTSQDQLDGIDIVGNYIANTHLERGPLVTGGGDVGMIRMDSGKTCSVSRGTPCNVAGDCVASGGGTCDQRYARNVRIHDNILVPGVWDNTGILIYGDRTEVTGNQIVGTLNVDCDESGAIDGRYSGIYVGSPCDGCRIERNTLKLDQGVDITSADITYGIRVDGADDVIVDGNNVTWTNATEANHQNKLGVQLQTGSDRAVITNNKFFGGMRGFASENGANNHVLLMGNYARNKYVITTGIFSLFQTTSSVAINNVCSTNTTGGTPNCVYMEPDTIAQGNVAFGTVALAANGGTNVTLRGTVCYGDSTVDALDTGDEACTACGKKCYDAKTSAGADSTCATDQGPAATPNSFMALCY